MAGATTRAAKAGKAEAESTIQTVHLFYQNNTALAYYRALCKGLNTELVRRENEKYLKGKKEK